MTTRRTPLSLSIVGITAGLISALALVSAPAASAAELGLTDPSGDNAVVGLDIVAADLDNDDYRLKTTVDFRRHRSGTVVVGLEARQRGLLRVVNQHDPDGTDRTLLLNSSGRVTCRGIRAEWDAADAEVTLSVPSTCLWNGNYGAVQPWVLTEPLNTGTDVDTLTTSSWTPRG